MMREKRNRLGGNGQIVKKGTGYERLGYLLVTKIE